MDSSRVESISSPNFEDRMHEAEEKARETLQLYRSISIENEINLGELHLETVKMNFRVAFILYSLEENEEAFTVFQDVYSKLKVISEPEDERALAARGYMANILRKTGKVALPIYQDIHEILSRKSPHKIITLSIKINIALELSDQGKFSESHHILDELIRIHRQINSNKDEIWLVLKLKVRVLSKEGKFSEATSIVKSLYEEHKAAYGEDDVRTWSILRDLGLVLADQGEYEQAEGILKVVLSNNKIKTDENANENMNLENQLFLALVLKKQGKLDESLALLKDLHMHLKNKPLDRSAFLHTLKLLANILDQQGKYKEALHLYIEILTLDPSDCPDEATTLNNIFRTMDQLRKSDKTGPSPNEQYEIEAKKFWEVCEDTVIDVKDFPVALAP